jgi:hypothetical protein
MAIAAYDAAEPSRRDCLDTLAGTMSAVLEATRMAMSADIPQASAIALAERAATLLRPLIARAGAVINGDADAGSGQATTPQAVVDGLMK